MKKYIISFAFICLFLSIATTNSSAKIAFTSGYWSCTFDCGDYNFCDQSNTSPTCINGSTIYSDGCNVPSGCSDTTEALTAADYSSGGGGSGLRIYYGDSSGAMSHYLALTFDTHHSAVWMRWYMKVPTGHVQAQKLLYLHDLAVGASGMVRLFTEQNTVEAWAMYYDMNLGTITSLTNLATIFGSLNYDNQWHCYEVYYDKGTGSNDGTVRFWIDNYLVGEWLNKDLGPATDPYRAVIIPSNLSQGTPAGCYQIDYDDYAIANSNYGSFVNDGHGNDRIGVIGGGGSAPEITVTNQIDNDASIDFGAVDINTTSDCIVTVRNDGNADLTLGTLSGLAAPFTLPVNNCNDAVLGSGATCTCTVRYSPTSVGASTQDTLVIPNDDGDENPVNVTCDGSGKEPVAGVSLGATVGVSGGGVSWE